MYFENVFRFRATPWLVSLPPPRLSIDYNPRHSFSVSFSLTITTPLDPSVSWKASLLHFSRWFEAFADYLAERHLDSHIVDNSFPLASGVPLWKRMPVLWSCERYYRALTFVEIKLRCVSMVISDLIKKEISCWSQVIYFDPLLFWGRCQFSILSAGFSLADWY